MAVISKDLGAVTAYAAAVNRGYTGTKEEFETLMASYATVAQQAAESAQSAGQSATDASGSAQTAETAKGTAQQAATDAQTAQASAQGYAQSAQQSAQSASQYAQSAESAKNTAVDAVDGFASGAQQALDGVNQAGNNWKSLAQAKALDSEAWALGKRGGEDVGAQDETCNNNAHWYALTAATDATTANNAAQTATAKAGEAAQSASAAAESARTLTIDATLTQSGQAADAKKTGGEITSLKEDLNAVATGDPINVYPTFQLGYLHNLPDYTPANPGRNVANNVVCGTDYISVADAEKLYFDSSNYTLCICYYNENKEYQRYVGFVSTPNPYVLDTDYAYFVPELRKTDSSAFSDDIPVDKLWYSGQVYTADIVRHGEFNNALASIETEISNIGTKKIIHPDILPTLPYNVYRTLDGYMCDTPITELDTSDWITVYVDSANGLDTNDGTENNPVKTLTRADYLCRVSMDDGKKTIIQIVDDSVFYIDDIPASYNAKKSYIIRADHKATIFAGKKPAFSASGNHYTSEVLTDYNPIGCVDISTQDDYGLYNPMVAVASENDVDETLNSYYIDTVNKVVHVNPSSDINDIVVIFSDKFAMNPATYGFIESSFFMVENITFVGNSTATGRAASTVGETIARTIFVKDCVFQHGFSNNCVSFNDFEYTYIVDCTAGYSKLDCFNYHFTRKPTPANALVVEVNNKSKEAGYYNSTSGFSDNLTTCHDSANILRCGCHGYNGNGGMCADVNGCYSVCLDCTFVNTAYADTMGTSRPAFFFENTSGTRNGKTVLQNCYGYDSRNNKMVTAIDLILNGINAGGSITATKISVGKDLI